MSILTSEPRFFSIGVTTACFIGGGTRADDSDVLMIRATENQCESLGAMFGVGPIHTISQRMSSLSVSRPMVTQVRRHANEPLPQSTYRQLAAETAYRKRIYLVCETPLESGSKFSVGCS